MKQKFREMQTNMQDQMNQRQDFSTQKPAQEKANSKSTKEDYIDFEEVR